MKKILIPSALVALSLVAIIIRKISAPGAALALTLVSLPVAHAGYNPAVVGSDARWVVYADFNTLRESALGKELITALSKAQAEATAGAIGLDIPRLLTTVGALTAYGTNLVSNPELLDGALIAEGTPDLRKIAESLLLQGTIAQAEVFSEITDLPFPAYAIGDPKAPPAQQVKLVIAFPPEPIVIVSKSKAQVIKARDVFRGKAPSLAKNSGNAIGKLGGVADGAYLFAATVVPGDAVLPEKSPEARMLQLTSSGALALGERGADTFAHAELLASSAANAEKLSKILDGLTAVLSFAETNDQRLGEFLKATSVEHDKDRVTLRLTYPTVRIVQMTQALQVQIQAKPRAAQAPAAPNITVGNTVATWGGDEGADLDAPGEDSIRMHLVENVTLARGKLITVGRVTNGTSGARIDRVEVSPAGGGEPLVFRREDMRAVGGRESMWQFAFPGTAGAYTLKVGYMNPAGSKAKFAVSLSDAKNSGRASGALPETPPVRTSPQSK